MIDHMQLETGCYVESRWGQYGPARLVSIAADLGFKDKAVFLAARKLARLDVTAKQDEQIVWASEAAEQWLNDNLAEDGFSWGWYEGEVFYMPNEWWEEA